MPKLKYKDQGAAKTAKIHIILTIIFALSTCIWGTIRIVKAVTFEIEVTSYLKRASVANTIDLAKTELGKAIKAAEEKNLTEGIVSIFLKNPNNDIGFWYQNMTAAYEELENISPEATQLERTNVLMKLRESLTNDSGESGSDINVPQGISIHPDNAAYFWWATISITGFCLFFLLTFQEA